MSKFQIIENSKSKYKKIYEKFDINKIYEENYLSKKCKPTKVLNPRKILEFGKDYKTEDIYEFLNESQKNLLNEDLKSFKVNKNFFEDLIKTKEEEQIRKNNPFFKEYDKSTNVFPRMPKSFNSPIEIENILNEYIVGQESITKIISQTVFNHLIILKGNLDFREQHLMLIGPSGCGKTEIFRVLKKILNLNVHILNISNLAFSGYSSSGGEHLDTKLKDVKNGDIVVFDEFDKLIYRNTPNRNDGNMLQAEFLKVIEDDTNKYDKCLFVFVGAFTSLIKESNSIGFTFSDDNLEKRTLMSENIVDDLINLGILNELLGRINYIVQLRGLTYEDYFNIVYNQHSVYMSYKEIYKNMFNLNVTIDDKILKSLCYQLSEGSLGIRVLNSSIEGYFNNLYYHIDEWVDFDNVLIDDNGVHFS